MEKVNRTNKPNIRTKQSTNVSTIGRWSTSVVDVSNYGKKWSSSALSVILCLVLLPQLVLSISLPSVTAPPISVLRIDPLASQIHIRLAEPLTIKHNEASAQFLNNDVLVLPTYSSVNCDHQDDVDQPLDVVGYENGVVIVSYANLILSKKGEHEAYLCVNEDGQLRHLGEESRFQINR